MKTLDAKCILAIASLLLIANAGFAADWPTFNHDNSRSGATAENIAAEQLKPAWVWRGATAPLSAWPGPAKWDAFANIPELTSMRNYDPVFHPAIVGNALFFSSSSDDSVHCLDAATGKERWAFTADAPVRIAPSISDGRVYFSSDDGAAYCVSAADGKLAWKFNPRPGKRLILNDGRLISPLPIRTGVLVDGGTAYFAAALLPWEPAILCAVDAVTGKPEGAGRFVRTFPDSTTFEGPLLCSQNKLIAPQGRVPPLLFDRATGEPLGSLDGAGGGCFVLLTPQDQVIHGPGNKQGQLVATRTSDRQRAAVIPQGRSMAVSADMACVVKPTSVHALDAQFKAQKWQVSGEYKSVIIAGNTIFLGGADEVVALWGADGKQLWRATVDGRAFGLAVAAGSLFVSTDAGATYCFRTDGAGESAPQAVPVATTRAAAAGPHNTTLASGPTVSYPDAQTALVQWETERDAPTVLDMVLDKQSQRLGDPAPKRKHEVRLSDLKRNRIYRCTILEKADDPKAVGSTFDLDTEFNFAPPKRAEAPNPFAADPQHGMIVDAAKHILSTSKIENGICLVIGAQRGALPYELATRSQLRVIALTTNESEVAAARAALLPTGRYGSQITVLKVVNPEELPVPGMFANLVVSEQALRGDRPGCSAVELYRVLRPQGGVAMLGRPSAAENKVGASWISFCRAARAEVEESKGPAGSYWAKVVRGRLPGSGQWTHQYGSADNSAYGGEELGGSVASGDFDTQWVGRPGPGFQPDRSGRMPGPLAAAGRLFVQGLNRILAMDSYNGTILWSREVPGMIRMNVPRDSSNWCTDGEHVYLAVRGECWQIAATNGAIGRKFPALAGANSNWKYDWSYVASDGPLLLGSSVKAGTAYTDFWGGSNWYDQPQGPETFKVCSDNLFALNKKTGETAWRYANGLILNPTITIGPGTVYFIECRHPAVAAGDTRRIGAAELWQQQFMVALEVGTGKKLWERPIDTHDGIAVFYLAYGEGKLAIVSSGNGAFHVYAFGAQDGAPAWDHRFGWPNGKADHGLAMSRPAIVGNKLFVRPMTFELATGKPLPQLIPGGGCGTYACAAGSLLFRAGHVTMWDAHSGNTSIWQRLRPGCWLSTIPADGLILSPEAGGGCSCGQWLETSIALVPRSYYPRPRIVATGEVFEGTMEVKLECVNPDGVIRYTLDGSEPKADSPAYEKPLTLTDAATVTARFYHRDGNHGLTAAKMFRRGIGDVVNLAPQATATATSEWNHTYAAKMATDGIVVPRGSRNDAGKAWSVFGPTAGGKGEFTLTWKEPVEIGEIIYFGRTAFGPEDNFKEVEIYLDNAAEPIRRATLEKIHGPQRLAIPPTKAKVLKLKFLNCHGGGNPGASEIMVFSKTPADALLPKS